MNSVPLVDALPWSDDENLSCLTNRTILVNDTVETEGRFMLHTLAAQFLSFQFGGSGSRSNAAGGGGGRVLWLACGPTTNKQVSTALKKIGCDAAAAYLRSLSSSSVSGTRSTNRANALKIISVTQELAMELAADNDGGGGAMKDNEMSLWNEEDYIKNVYKRVKAWLADNDDAEERRQPTRDLIILDDASTLASICGEYIAYAFIQQLYTMTNSQDNSACFAIRCSNDVDVERYMTTTEQSTPGGGSGASTSLSSSHAKGSRDWVGAGSNNEEQVRIEEDAEALLTKPPWERSLVEMADGIVDVLPLLSGFSREAHGRIVFTERLGGRGWTSKKTRDLWKRRSGDGGEGRGALVSTGTVVNYRCSDSGVIAFRLRSGS